MNPSASSRTLPTATSTLPAPRRKVACPVYQALRANVLRFEYGLDPVPVAFELGPTSNQPQVTAVAATHLGSTVKGWCSQLARDIKADRNCEVEDPRFIYMPKPMCLENWYLKEIGRWDGWDDSPENDSVLCQGFMFNFLLDPSGSRAVGLAAIEFMWRACKFPSAARPINLNVDVETAWIAPGYRGKGYSKLLNAAVADAAWRTIHLVHEKTHWTNNKPSKLEVSFGGDVEAEAGEQFLISCRKKFVDVWISRQGWNLNHFKVGRIGSDARY